MAFEVKYPIEELKKRKLFVGVPMYGGQCLGLFCRSIADLSAICANYGIQLQLYFLFNESLITRARNYCCDEFVRSGFDHLMFIDADIGFNPQDVILMMAMQAQDPEKYDVLCGPYPKKSQPGFAKVLTQDGYKTIKSLVKTKYNGTVLSFNHATNGFEWKQVVNHFESPSKGKRWVGLKTNSNMPTLYATHDHECAVFDDVLKPDIKYVEAEHTIGKYIVVHPEEITSKNRRNPLYNEEQISCLIGTLMGDGSITKAGYLKFGHSNKQYEYLEFKQKLFGGKVSKEKKTGAYKGKEYHGKFLDCPRNEQILRLRELMYPEGEKTIKNIIDMIDVRALAMWYMDDGSLSKANEKETAIFCTDSYSNEDLMAFQNLLETKWNIKTTIQKNNRLYVLADSADNLFKLISNYVIPELEYKLPEEYRGGTKYEFNTKLRSFGAYKIKEVITDNHVIRTRCNTQYDLSVEDNHNFVSGGFLISNCISWEKIKLAVNKGFADDDPNTLDRFVGDYVFNPKSDQREIPIGEPVEVLEGGTGFMMISRNALEKFKAAFPDRMYRPDHVRTEHFDGTREIMMYFQAEIDQYDPKFKAFELLEQVAKGTVTFESAAEQAAKIIEETPALVQASSKRYLSEDYLFCYMAQKIGLKVWLCPWMRLQHVGTFVFGGSLADLAAIGASATADVSQLKKNKKKDA